MYLIQKGELMKRHVSVIITIFFCLSIGSPIMAADNQVFSVEITGTPDTTTTLNGQSTIVLDWRILTNREGQTLRYAQGLRLAYDNTVLQLVNWDGEDSVDDSILSKNFTPIPGTGILGDFNTDLILFAAQNDSGELGYLNYLLGSPFDAYDCPQGSYLTLAQIRFAFRDGKSADDLTADTIRFMTASELYDKSQSTAILLNTDENDLTSYEYLKHENGVAMGGDTIIAPTITYPHSNVEGNGGINNSETPNETSDSAEEDISSSSVDQNSSIPQVPISEQQPPLSDQAAPPELSPASVELTSPNELSGQSDEINLNEQGSGLIESMIAVFAITLSFALIMISRAKKPKRAAETAGPAQESPDQGIDPAIISDQELTSTPDPIADGEQEKMDE